MKLFRNPLVWIFLVALFLRIYKLSEFPVGLHVDEVKVGWNAISIAETLKDDKGNFLPLYYNSFGDYRPAGIIYLAIPAVISFGNSVFGIRFISSLFGALSIFPLYLLTNSFAKLIKSGTESSRPGYLAAILLAMSQWHIETSRATSEVVISTFFAIFALYFFIELIKTGKKSMAILSSTFTIVSYLLYHSIRVLSPIFYLVTFFIYFKDYKSSKIKKFILIPIIISISLSVYLGTTFEARQRYNELSITKDLDLNYEIERIRSENFDRNIFSIVFDNKTAILGKFIARQYGQYFGPDFLIGYSAKPYRYTTPGTGLLNYIELVLLIIGIMEIVRGKKHYLPLLLLLIAPLPAMITIEDTPNLHRAFLMIPFLITIEAFGLEKFIAIFKKKYLYLPIILMILSYLAFSLYFFYMYFSHSDNHKPFIKNYFVDGSTYRNVGTIELAYKIEGIKDKYDKIVITNYPDSPYPWYAFFTNKSSVQFNKTYQLETNERNFENIIFSEDKCPSDYAFTKYKEKRLLVINSWECPQVSQIKSGLKAKIVDTILRTDKSEVFVFLERDNP